MFNNKPPSAEYQQTIYGTWGNFSVGNSTVAYLQTKARVGMASKDMEKRLSTFLHPVREVLPTAKMDFNQLLQRDLDDHRVASNLVPYILSPSHGRPAFFPPVVAALLPFEGKNVIPKFPGKAAIAAHVDDSGTWAGYSFGSAFKYEKLVMLPSGDDFNIKVGRLAWNQEEAKLVVIDGQHRAMALIAIDRTINGTWTEAGEKYKYFYEPVIKELLSKLSSDEKKSLIASLEFPVTLIWFPESNELDPLHHEVARHLFVDINKNARTPSESRILLLSDSDLLSIFTRGLLNMFRASENGLPIFSIEYDHPGRDQASSSKWSAVSNVIILRDCVSRAVFGPAKFIDNPTTTFGGRESITQRGAFMQKTLRIGDQVPEVCGDMKRADIDEENFPRETLAFLDARFKETWGLAIHRILSGLTPYKVHGEALVELGDAWGTGDSTGTLAKDAIFEGVGMYWTIRDAYQHWESENRILREGGAAGKAKTDIVKTWEVLEEKSREFKKRRAKRYLGKDSEEHTLASDKAYDVFNTNACQLGLVLTLRTIVSKAGIEIENLSSFFDAVIVACNAALASGGTAAYKRFTVFSRANKSALNQIPKLDTPAAIYFRYFWLELLSTGESITVLKEFEQPIKELRDSSRGAYLAYLVEVLSKSIRVQFPDKQLEQVRLEAKESATKSLKESLRMWFAVQGKEFDDWKHSLTKPGSQITEEVEAAAKEAVLLEGEDFTNDTPVGDLIQADDDLSPK